MDLDLATSALEAEKGEYGSLADTLRGLMSEQSPFRDFDLYTKNPSGFGVDTDILGREAEGEPEPEPTIWDTLQPGGSGEALPGMKDNPKRFYAARGTTPEARYYTLQTKWNNVTITPEEMEELRVLRSIMRG